jgi:hypothetical protein
MRLNGKSADKLAAQLIISPPAVSEAIRRGFVSFKKHRGVTCWRFGDTRNGCFRRLDGLSFKINGQRVKAEAETRGDQWHRLIGLDDVSTNDRREILLITEGSKDALAALHFAYVEGRLADVGVAAALGAGVNLRSEDIERLRGRRIRIFGDADTAGQETVSRLGKQLLATAEEVQIFNLAGLRCENGSPVKDLFDLTQIDCDDFEANPDLWSITDLNTKGERVNVLRNEHEFSFSPSPLPHVSPVSNGQGLNGETVKVLKALAARNACTESDTARTKRWQLVRDLRAVEKRIGREPDICELMPVFEEWHQLSGPFLDPAKTREAYLAAFLKELRKVRVPTGEGDTLNKALEAVSKLSPSELPVISGMLDVPESWRRLLALHCELSGCSTRKNKTYFLSYRDAAKAHNGLSHQVAYDITLAFDRLGIIQIVDKGQAHANGGKAAEFQCLLPPLPNGRDQKQQ